MYSFDSFDSFAPSLQFDDEEESNPFDDQSFGEVDKDFGIESTHDFVGPDNSFEPDVFRGSGFDEEYVHPFDLPDLQTSIAHTESVLPNIPDYYEKFSSTRTDKKASVAMSTISEYLQQADIDYVTLSGPRIEASIQQQTQLSTFAISFFQCDGSQSVMVEFRRLSGCPFLFTKHFNAAASLLAPQHAPLRNKGLRMPPTFVVPVPAHSDTVKSDSVKSLVSIAVSNSSQKAKQQAIASLAEHTKAPEAVCDILPKFTDDIVSILATLDTTDTATQRAMAKLLENMSHHASIREHSADLVPLIQSCLSAFSENPSPDGSLMSLVCGQTQRSLESGYFNLTAGARNMYGLAF